MNAWVLFVAFCIPSIALAADAPALPACHFEQQTRVIFSNPSEPDSLSVSVRGKPCFKARAVILITNRAGRVIYRFEESFKTLTATAWDDPELPAEAKRFVSGTTSPDAISRTSALPKWEPPDAFYENNFTGVAVSRKRYEELRRQDVPAFYHPTYYEGGVTVVYDAAKQATVAVLKGGR